MDPHTYIIGAVAFVVICILLYFITTVTMREKTFEDVMAEQKKRQEEEREKLKNDKKVEKENAKKKYRKGKGDKSKEKSAQVSEPELKDSPKAQQKEHKMVNLEIEPEIIEPSESMVLSSSSSKPRNRMNALKKSILHNKDEVTPVTDKEIVLPHKLIKPLDDLELKRLHETQEHHPSPKKEKSGQSHAELMHDTKEAVKEVKMQKVKSSMVEAMEIQQGAAIEEKKITKSKSATAVESSPSKVSGGRVIDTVRNASLTDQEVQTLIDILLNRQGAAAAATQESWNKKSQKGDPMALMKKQLEEKEKALQEEQQLAMSSTNRLKELRNELTAERTKLSLLEKQWQEKLGQQLGDYEALQARMRQAHEQHMVESTKMQAHIQQLEKAGDATLLQQLKQENRILQDSLSKASMESVSPAEMNNLRQKVAIMEKELSSNAVRLNSSENAKKAFEDKLKKYEDQIRKMESSKGSEETLAKKLEEASEALRKAESKNGGLNTDLKKTAQALTSADSECTTLKMKLQELEKQLSSSEDLGTKMQESERKKQELEGNMKNLEKQLTDSVHRQEDVVRQLQDSERKKQEMDGNMKNLEKQLTDAVKRQEEMGAELQRMRQENSTLTQEVKTTKERLQTMEAAPAATNGDIHTESPDKDVIQITEHERIVSEKVATVQSELTVQQQSSQSQLTELKAQLEAQKQKNNELREKNWKAMEALDKAEKSAAEKVDKSLKSSRETVTKAVSEVEKSDKEVLKRLFPAVSVSDKMGHKEWLASFEKQVTVQLMQSSKSEKNVNEKLNQLEAENSHLQAEVEVVRNNLAILQHSENSRVDELEEENKNLQQQSENYQKELKQLNADRDRLQEVEEENQRLKSSAALDSSLSQEVSQLQSENQELHTRLAGKDKSIAEAEKKLHNLEHVVETEDKKWKEKLRLAAQNASKGSEPSDREQELEELTIEHQSQIEHYRNVLMSTESVLQNLESAEKSWEDRLQTSQTDLQKASAECQRIQAELQTATSRSSQLQSEADKVRQELQQSSATVQALTKEKQELASKVIVLETQSKAVVQVDNEDIIKKLQSEADKARQELQQSSATVQVLTKEKQELASKVIVLETQSKAVVQVDNEDIKKLQSEADKARQELQQSSATVQALTKEKQELASKMIVLETQSKAVVQVDNEDIKKRLEEVERLLEKEQKKVKDLSSTVVRLNGIIKTGQDALIQEQKLVSQLQEQLTDRTKGSGGSAGQEIQQLRRQLREKEKLLEQERTAVRQLKQKLGTSASNDMGSSV